MVSVMKSPNMMSTTGRMPVMAAPTARPVKPASEMGVSRTRSLPNSSTRPERTLKGVPASATSSPMMQTVGSRRISSASASRMACAKVSSRSAVSGIDILVHLIGARVRRRHREFHRFLHCRLNLRVHPVERGGVGQFLFDQPLSQVENRVAFGFPGLLFLLRAIVFAVNVSDVMAVVAVGVTKQKRRSPAATRALHQQLGKTVHRAHVLPIHADGFEVESSGAVEDLSCRGFRVVGVFRVQVVLAYVDYRKLEELGEVHHFVEQTLPESALSEETHGHLARAQALSGKG